MRLRRTAAGGMAAMLALASCSSSEGGSAGSSLPETTTTSVVVTTTTTVVVPASTTTTVVADATTADPEALAQQLQAVLDRYVELYRASRTEPNRPFTDEDLLSQLRQTASVDFIGTFLIPKWNQYRDEGAASRPGPTTGRRLVLTGLVVATSQVVSATFCAFDDGVSYRYSDGAVLDDEVAVERGKLLFSLRGEQWLLDELQQTDSTGAGTGSPNTCDAEAAVK